MVNGQLRKRSPVVDTSFCWQWRELPSSVCFRASMVNTAKQHCSKDVQSLTVLASSDISLVGYWRSVTCQGMLEYKKHKETRKLSCTKRIGLQGPSIKFFEPPK